mgnify:FL=1
MVDIYPVRQVVNYPGVPLQVQVTNPIERSYANYNLISTTAVAGTIYYIATVSLNEEVDLAYAVSSSTTVNLVISVNGSTYSYAIGNSVLPNSWYAVSFPVMSGATIGISVTSNTNLTAYILY